MHNMIRIMLCSDEFGGEHTPIRISAADLGELQALGYRRIKDPDHYSDGAETWQGPARTMQQAYKRWAERKTR